MHKKFNIDQQTLTDINISASINGSVFGYFDQTVTEGGQHLLRSLFNSPLGEVHLIEKRQQNIKKFMPFIELNFYFDKLVLKDLQKYVSTAYNGGVTVLHFLNFFRLSSPEYFYTKRSIREFCEIMIKMHGYIIHFRSKQKDLIMDEMLEKIEACLQNFFTNKNYKISDLKINSFNIDHYDRIIRKYLAVDIIHIFNFFYEIDAYLSIAKVAVQQSFCFPKVYCKGQSGSIDIQGLYHLFHKVPVKNDILMKKAKKMWFLTGANMAGKSTIIKTISIAIYLTHIGFPVPAISLKTDVLDGLFTSINLHDDFELGYSHFYSEAMRLKTILDQLDKKSNALIILDELFKGTNQNDASQAILEVIKYLSEIDGPFVIISSHITDLYQDLKNIPIIDFIKLDIARDASGLPIFTYKVTRGVAEEKLGMWLLSRSGVFNSLRKLI